MMNLSIITAVRNGAETLRGCVESVRRQTVPAEHIIIDGASTDGTFDIIARYRSSIAKVVSEPDKGIYDALNKGIRLASGDVIGLLHGDDLYAHDKVLETVIGVFEKQNVDSCYGDLLYVHKNDIDRVIRHWKASEYYPGRFKYGWMPPHPTFFVKREIYERYGYFNMGFRIAADYELMLRFLEKHNISTHYIPEVLIKMRLGGASNRSLKNMWIKSSEDYRAWKVNNLNGGLSTIFLKNISKIPQFFVR
jgi:glycosyltransferase involved in cell wall biosynthesis